MEKTKTEVSHTPTPWKLGEDQQIYDEMSYTISTDGQDDEVNIVQTCGGNSPIESVANAAFIIRAVNSHEALLEAAKYVRDRMFMAGVGNELPRGSISIHCYELLKKAIQQAEGKL